MTELEFKEALIKWVETKTPFKIKNELLLNLLDDEIKKQVNVKVYINDILQEHPSDLEMISSILKHWLSNCKVFLAIDQNLVVNLDPHNSRQLLSEDERIHLLNELLDLENKCLG